MTLSDQGQRQEEQIKISQWEKTRQTATFATCEICRVKFSTAEQVDQHILYHQSDEFFNYWLALYKKLHPTIDEEEDMKPIEISEPTEFFKFKPTDDNSIPIKEQQPIGYLDQEPKTEYAISAESLPYPWNNTKDYPTCKLCGKEFVHINTLKKQKKLF